MTDLLIIIIICLMLLLLVVIMIDRNILKKRLYIEEEIKAIEESYLKDEEFDFNNYQFDLEPVKEEDLKS